MKKKILLVEDDKALSQALEIALSAGHEVSAIDNGTDALSVATKKTPDIIVLDVGLPDINGISVLKELKNQPATASIPVLVLTNMNDAQTVSDIISAGGKEYIIKSDWSLEDIVKKVDSLI